MSTAFKGHWFWDPSTQSEDGNVFLDVRRIARHIGSWRAEPLDGRGVRA
jgi:hypothetical protein